MPSGGQNSQNIVENILAMDGGRLGSFGEHLFGCLVPGAVRGGRKGTDFDVPGLDKRVDVKATCRHIARVRQENKPFEPAGRSESHEIRANVVFYADVVSVHYDDASIALLSWERLTEFFTEWMQRTGKTARQRRVVQPPSQSGAAQPQSREQRLAANLWHIKAWDAEIRASGLEYSKLSLKERGAIIQRVAKAYEAAHPEDAVGGIWNALAANIVFQNAKTMKPTWINCRLYVAAYMAGVYSAAQLNERLFAMLLRGALHPEGGSLRANFDAVLAEAGLEVRAREPKLD